jgi:hypothetical protein
LGQSSKEEVLLGVLPNMELVDKIQGNK